LQSLDNARHFLLAKDMTRRPQADVRIATGVYLIVLEESNLQYKYKPIHSAGKLFITK
jgi:hypothetical protein